MFGIIGILIVIGAVTGGFLMEKGNLLVLAQPAELVIIAGAAAGTALIANPPSVLKGILGGFGSVFGGSKFGKPRYLDTLKQLFTVMQKVRKGGLSGLEADIED